MCQTPKDELIGKTGVIEDKLSEIFKNNKGIVRITYFEKQTTRHLQAGCVRRKNGFSNESNVENIVLNLRVNKSPPNRCQLATST